MGNISQNILSFINIAEIGVHLKISWMPQCVTSRLVSGDMGLALSTC
jgi:hypothetical protein